MDCFFYVNEIVNVDKSVGVGLFMLEISVNLRIKSALFINEVISEVALAP